MTLTRRTVSRIVAVFACVLSAGLLVSCAYDEHTRSSESAAAPIDRPEFSGPWAQEFSDAWSTSTTDFERRVLEDGVVSELENSEMLDRLERCMSDSGLTFTDRASGYEFTFPDSMSAEKANTIADDCERTSGEWTVGTMFAMVSRNPQNQDDSTLVASCLVRVGAVPPGYTADDWDAEQETPTALTDAETASPDVWACADDPLSLVDG